MNLNASAPAPAATAGFGNHHSSAPPICANCQTSTTPLWRRDESGSVLCNACGLFLKLHGRPRPISLKTDVIKSRNRVKTAQSKKRDTEPTSSSNSSSLTTTPIYPPDHQHHHHHQQQQQSSNIAPQHIFDTVSLPTADTFASPNLPHISIRHHPDPPSTSHNTTSTTPQSYDDLIQQNNSLRTRVSELEVINDLFRGRVAELENSELDARHKDRARDDDVQRMLAELATANARVAALEARVRELDGEEGPVRKKMRGEREGEREGGMEVDMEMGKEGEKEMENEGDNEEEKEKEKESEKKMENKNERQTETDATAGAANDHENGEKENEDIHMKTDEPSTADTAMDRREE